MAKPDDPTKWYLMAQLVAACQDYTVREAEYEVAARVRDDAIRRSKKAGLTLAEIANIAGLSRGRVQQIVPGDTVEREPAEQDADQQAVS